MKTIDKKTKYGNISFATPEQLKKLLIQFKKKKQSMTSFVNEAIKEMIDILENVNLSTGNNLKTISITRPPKEIEERMVCYVKVKRLFTSRGSLISSAILYKILNQIPINGKKNNKEDITMEEYLEKNNLKIIGIA